MICFSVLILIIMMAREFSFLSSLEIVVDSTMQNPNNLYFPSLKEAVNYSLSLNVLNINITMINNQQNMSFSCHMLDEFIILRNKKLTLKCKNK